MAGYRTLQHIVSGYFAHYNWYCGEDHEDDLRITPLTKRWKGYRDECSVSAIPARNWYSLVGHGVHIRILNDKRQFQYHWNLTIPGPVYALFPGIPNRVEVDSHYRFLSDADFVARKLALKVADGDPRGGRIILLDVDDEATRVKTNPLLEPDERFARLVLHAERYLPLKADLADARKQLQRAAGTVWPAISAEARRFLLTGLISYEEYDAAETMLLDSSPGIVVLAKALELEVNRRLLIPFRQWLSQQGYTPRARGDLKLFASASAPDSPRFLELGRFGFYLRAIAEDRRGSAQPISQAFTTFCQEELADPIFVLEELPDFLLKVAQSYRNPAAHAQLVGFSDFREFLELLLVDNGSGLLQRMIKATRPRAQPL